MVFSFGLHRSTCVSLSMFSKGLSVYANKQRHINDFITVYRIYVKVTQSFVYKKKIFLDYLDADVPMSNNSVVGSVVIEDDVIWPYVPALSDERSFVYSTYQSRFCEEVNQVVFL